MCATFTEDDVGKTVEDPSGTAIGIVASIEGETALVEPEPDAMDSIKAALGWESDPDETVPITPDSVDVITGETVRLESDRSSEHDEDASGDGHDPVIERDEGTGGQRGVGSPGDGTDASESEQTQVEGEAGGERHDDNEDAPPHGDRTVTTDRGREDDR
ncbi:hypothetical protein [Halopiger djelfimassiliensis]|uniref:hypothetical protein n=1 Tax=Halopiger djelfimassiliensis TaxID=1293047 RepID=UPI0006782FAD|nr:hypothetical protein [Halopiger djelfimassiliensis]